MALDYSALLGAIDPLLYPPFPRLCAPEWLPYWDNLEFAYVNAYGFGPMDVAFGPRGPDPALLHAGVLYKETAFGLSAFWYDDATTGRRASFRLSGPWSSAGTDRDRFTGFAFGFSEVVPDGIAARMYLTANSADQQWCIGHDWTGDTYAKVFFRHSLTEFRKVNLVLSPSAETWRSFGISYDGANGHGWLNGKKVGSVATVGAYKGTPRISVGATGNDSDKESINGPVPVAYVWKNRVLTDAEMAKLAADPFGPLRVPRGSFSPSGVFAPGRTMYFLSSTVDGWGELQIGGSAPTPSTLGTGWRTEGLSAGQYARMAFGSVRAASAFSGTAQPSSGPDGALYDCFRSPTALTGDFAAGRWSIILPLIAATAAEGASLRARYRLWRSVNADGSSPTEITSGAVVGSSIVALQTAIEQVSSAQVDLGAFALTNEYLFVQVAAETV